MRNTTNGMDKAFALGRVIILALCFAVVFTLTLCGTFGDIVSPSVDNVVYAAGEGDGGAEAEGAGTATPSTEITASAMGFPGGNSGTRTWTQTVSFNDYSKVLLFTKAFNGAAAEDDTITSANQSSGSTLKYYVNCDTSQLYGYVGFSVQMGTFLNKMISSDSKTTVTAQVTGSMKGEFSNVQAAYNAHILFGASASNASITQSTIDGYSYSELGKDDSSITKSFDKTITLTQANPKLLVYFQTYVKEGVQKNLKLTTTITNLQIKFTVTLPQSWNDDSSVSIDDGAAPKIGNYSNVYPYRTTATSGTPSWYLTPSTSEQNASYMQDVFSKYNNSLDSYTNGKAMASLLSYTNSTYTSNGITCYKTISVEFEDYYNYNYSGSDVTHGDAVSPYFSAGLREIRVGDYDATKADSFQYVYQTMNAPKPFSVEGVPAGVYTITKTSRNKVTVNLYINANCNITVQAFDFGGKTAPAVQIDVRGIDTTKPNGSITATSTENYVAIEKNWNAINWYHGSTFVVDLKQNEELPEVENADEYGCTPYAWFYTVKKVNNPDDSALAPSIIANASGLKTKVPFAVGDADTFTYDFKTAYAMPSYNTDGTIKTGILDNSAATGCGYYLFTFYTMDLAGNYDSATNVISYYVKADYDLPTYTISKSVNNTVLASNEAWGTNGELVVTLDQSNVSISGNVLSFVDTNSNDTSIAVLDGQVVSVTTKTSYTIEGNVVKIGGKDRKGRTDGSLMTVAYEVLGGHAIWTFTFSIETIQDTAGEYLLLDYLTNFDMLVGSSLSPYIETSYKLSNCGAAYASGYYIRSDRNVPDAPYLSDTDGNAEHAYVAMTDKDNYNTIPALAGRSWYTSSWSFPAVLTFEESELESYGKDINVYIAMKNITTIDDFIITGGKKSVVQFVNDFASGYGDLSTYNFTKVISYAGNNIDEITDVTLDLVESNGAGMRLFFVWAVDQAGNVSDLSFEYVLADANQYYATAYVDNEYFGNKGSVVTGGKRASYKRGSEAKFEFTLDEGYVPYRLEYRLPGEEASVLWEVEAENATLANQMYQDEFVTLEGTNFLVKLDARDDLGVLKNSNGDVFVYFVYREVITFSVTNQNVYYSGAPTDVPMSLNDAAAKPFAIYNFKDRSTGDAIGYVPVNIGDFKVDIEFNDAHYISQKVVDMNYSIIPAKVTVSAIAGSEEYGDDHILAFAIDGLVGDDLDEWDAETCTYSGVKLTIPAAADVLSIAEGVAPYADLAIGTYPIILDSSTFDFGENYDVKFVTANFIVTVNYIDVTIVSKTKIYGNTDPEFEVTFDLVTAKIDESDLETIFKNATYTISGTTVTLKGKDGQLVMRNAGEDVGTYAFSDNAAAFEIDENYGVRVLRAGSSFTINKLAVDVEVVSGQEFNKTADNTYPIAIKTSNAKYANYLSLYTNAVSRGTQKSKKTEGNFTVYIYAVNGSNQSTANIDFVFNTNGTITVKEWTDFTLPVYVLSAKQNYTIHYGDTWNNAFAYDDCIDLFDLEMKNIDYIPEGYSLRWNADIAGSTVDGFYPVGTYTVTISNAKVYDDKDMPDASYNLVVGTYQVTVLPVEIEIVPVVTVNEKTYGDAENTFSIGFDVDNIPESLQSAVNKDSFKGTFARAIYEKKNNAFVAFGSQFDFATDENGYYTKNSTEYYYGAAVSTAFTCTNANFIPVVKAETIKKPLFAINPAEIEIEESAFESVGKDKSYDGSTLVKYTDVELRTLINIGRQLKNGTDDVFVNFTANYSDSEIGDGKTITITDVRLDGTYAGNYILVKNFDTHTTDAIFRILSVPALLTRNHFNITKVYDGTKTLNASNIIISEDCVFFGTPFKVITKGLSFASENVTYNFATSIELFFPGISSSFILDEKSDEKISVETGYTYEGETGLKVTIFDLSGSITPRVVTIDDITEISAINRRYNGYSDVTVEYGVKNGVIQEGDTLASLGFVLGAYAYDDTDPVIIAGTHKVGFDEISNTLGSNYAVGFTVEQLNAKFDYITVIIDRARILLNLDFSDNKQYAGNKAENQELQKGASKGEGDVNNAGVTSEFVLFGEDTVGFNTDVWDSDVANMHYDYASLQLFYTIDGQPDASVAVDEDGNVLKHNVKFSNLIISQGAAHIFDNYAILAYEFDGGEYKEVSIDAVPGTIQDFEIVEIATLNKKQLVPDISGVNVLDKIYDGTKNAVVTMGDITKIGVVEEEKDFIEVVFTGLFESKDYSGEGKTSKVSINISGLKNTEAAGGKDYTSNYAIVGSLPCTAARTIYQAPIAINAIIESKTYDGTNVVPDSNIKANFVDMEKIYPAETDSYYVDYKFACYDDVNAGETTGTVFGMSIIKTSNNSTINYKLVYADSNSTNALPAEKLGNLPTEDKDGNAIYYHDLETVSVYALTEAQYNKYGTPAYIGTYVRMGQKYYVVGFDAIDPSYDLSELTLTSMQVFRNAAASIAPKQIKLSVAKKAGSTAFSKEYDGTNVFNGIVNEDYVIEKTSAFENDDADYIALNPAEVSTKFLRTSAGKTSVEFSFTANVLKPADSALATDKENVYKNYSCTKSVVLLAAEITKLQINALLENSSITYGEVPESFADKVSYSVVHGVNEYELSIVDGKAYIAESDYDLFFVNYLSTFADADAIEAAKLTKLYELVDGEFVFANGKRDAGKSYYIVLDGNFTAPTVSANVSTATKVGTYSYKLVGGSATDYVFVYKYEDDAPSATLTVEKADLIVRVKGDTEGFAYSRYYGYENPAIQFEFEGFKNNDGEYLVSNIAAEFRLFEGGVAMGGAIDKTAEISSELAANQYYAAYITNAGTALNYNIVADNDKRVKLGITIEPITGVKFTDKTVAYNGTSKADVIVPSNVPEGATVTYKYFAGGKEVAASDIVNAGIYNVEATVVKSIDGTANHNSIATFSANLTITQISFTMKFKEAGKSYDKKAVVFNLEKDVILFGVVEADKANILAALENGMTIYAKNTKGDYVSQSSIKDAGSYKIEFVFDNANNYNYTSFTYSTTYTISPIDIVVTLPEQYKRQLVDEENGNDIDGMFEYAIAEEYASRFNENDLSESKFKLQYQYSLDGTKYKWGSFDDIFGTTGTYPYELTYNDKNFRLVGDNRGTIIIGTNVMTNDISENGSNGVVYATAKFTDGVILNSPYTFIEYSNITSASDFDYWKNVNAYMPGLADKYHSTKLSAIVKLRVADFENYYDMPSAADMEVAIPANVKKLAKFQVYYVNNEGGLSALENYTVDKGMLKYSTDRLATLVFVQVDGVNVIGLMDNDIPYWLLGVVGGVALLLILGIILGAVFGAKAAKKKKGNLALETAGAGEAAPEAPIEEPVEEAPAEEPAPEEPAEEPAPEEPAEEPATEPEPEQPTEEPAVEEPAAPAEEAPAPRVRPAKPEHIGKKKPPVIGMKASAPAAPEADKKIPPVVGKKD